MSENVYPNQDRRIVHYSILHHDFEYSDSFVMKVQSDNEERQACEIIAEIFATDEDDKHIVTTGLLKNGTATIYDQTIYDVRVEDLDTITIFVIGGVIQDIQNIPSHIRVKIQDYDVDPSTDMKKPSKDQYGVPCMISIWDSGD
jgi:hypothetical protein